jgi:hypothetical protein
MFSLYGGKSLRRAVNTLTLIPALMLTSGLALIPAVALIAAPPVCRAESGGSNSGANLGKHARKVHREIEHFRTGSYIHLTLADGSERTIALVSFDDSSFTGTNAESNNRETHTYDEIARVTREKDYIGEGSEGHVRHIRMWVPITLAVVAAGAAFTAAEVR